MTGPGPTGAGGAAALRQRLLLYGEAAGWLLRDLVRQARGLFVLLVGLTVLAVVAKLVTFAALLIFATARLGSGEAAFRDLSIRVGESAGDTAGWGALILGSAVVMATSQFAAGRLRVRLGRRYAVHSIRTVMTRLTSPAATTRGASLEQAEIRRLIGGDAVLLVRAVQPVTGALLPLLQLVVSLILLVVISAELTALLALLAAAYAIPFFRVNRRVVEASRRRETTAPALSRLSRGVSANLLLEQYARPSLVDRYTTSTELRDHLDTVEEIIGNKHRVQRINDVFLGVAALIMVLYMAGAEDGPATRALNLLAFVAVARFAYGSVSLLTRSFVAFNRFLPQFRRYVDFSRSDDLRLRPAGEGSAREVLPLRVVVDSPTPLSPALASLLIEPGAVVSCLQPYAVDGVNVRRWWGALVGDPSAPGLGRVFLAGDPRTLPPLPLEELLLPPPGAQEGSAARVRALLQRAGVWDEAQRWSETEGSALASRMSDTLRLLTALAPGVAVGAPLLVVARRDWTAAPDEVTREIRRALGDDVVILLTSSTAPRGLPAASSSVVVLDEHGVVGLGDSDWWGENQARVAELLAPATTAGQPAPPVLLDDGDDDDEDV